MIRQIEKREFDIALSVIRRSFETVARDFGITKENCPNHTSFINASRLESQAESGYIMFGLFEGGEMLGYASLSKEGDSIYELHNLSVLPECRHKGYGKMLIDYAKNCVSTLGGAVIRIGIIEENDVLKSWYTANGFVHMGTKKFSHLPFTSGFMEWRLK